MHFHPGNVAGKGGKLGDGRWSMRDSGRIGREKFFWIVVVLAHSVWCLPRFSPLLMGNFEEFKDSERQEESSGPEFRRKRCRRSIERVKNSERKRVKKMRIGFGLNREGACLLFNEWKLLSFNT